MTLSKHLVDTNYPDMPPHFQFVSYGYGSTNNIAPFCVCHIVKALWIAIAENFLSLQKKIGTMK